MIDLSSQLAEIESHVIWRIQGSNGRGPFKPGFTSKWKGDIGLDLPPIYFEIGMTPQQMNAWLPFGPHYGVGCSSREQLYRWFNRGDRHRLMRLGYREIAFRPVKIIARTPNQVLFAHDKPLASLW